MPIIDNQKTIVFDQVQGPFVLASKHQNRTDEILDKIYQVLGQLLSIQGAAAGPNVVKQTVNYAPSGTFALPAGKMLMAVFVIPSANNNVSVSIAGNEIVPATAVVAGAQYTFTVGQYFPASVNIDVTGTGGNNQVIFIYT